jgi:hypothetical protein
MGEWKYIRLKYLKTLVHDETTKWYRNSSQDIIRIPDIRRDGGTISTDQE